MEIGIIGAGQVGGTLTRHLTKQGHTVRVSNSRAPETLADLAAETGATAVWAKDAPVDADLVIVTIPQMNVTDLAPGIVSTAKPGSPVIDTNNYFPKQRDGQIEAIDVGTPDSVWVAEQLGVPVFKVFNGLFWKRLVDSGVPRGTAGRIALPIAGDDAANKKIVSDLVDQIGFDPVDAGTLAESWRQQPYTPVYGTDLDVEGVKKALAEALPERPESFLATG